MPPYLSPPQLSLQEIEAATPGNINRTENDLNRADNSKPKLSFLNKLKKSFKSCSSDKSKTNIPQVCGQICNVDKYCVLSLNTSITIGTLSLTRVSTHTTLEERGRVGKDLRL